MSSSAYISEQGMSIHLLLADWYKIVASIGSTWNICTVPFLGHFLYIMPKNTCASITYVSIQPGSAISVFPQCIQDQTAGKISKAETWESRDWLALSHRENRDSLHWWGSLWAHWFSTHCYMLLLTSWLSCWHVAQCNIPVVFSNQRQQKCPSITYVWNKWKEMFSYK